MRIFSGMAIAAGITLLAAGGANAASFDCQAAELKADEKAICENRDLNDADVRMVTTFELISGLMAMGSRGALQDEQVAWLTARQSCNGDVDCIRAAYAKRMEQLKAVYDKIERPL